MAMFVTTEPVAVQEGDNIVWIRPKMNIGLQQRVLSDMSRISMEMAGAHAQQAQVNFDMGAYNLSLLVNNVVRWEGPAFDGHPCTPENIKSLDPDEPLVKKVVEEIARRNQQQEAEQELPKAS